jgi:hypothetical protein
MKKGGSTRLVFQAEFEKSLAIKEQQAGFGVSNPRLSGLQCDDADSAQWEVEFNAWLDAYEKSFGDYL